MADTHCCRVRAALFDGHGTAAAGEWLSKSLYSQFSDEVDDQMLNSYDDSEPCEISGAQRPRSPSIKATSHCLHTWNLQYQNSGLLEGTQCRRDHRVPESR